jgi:hypothetical protein
MMAGAGVYAAFVVVLGWVMGNTYQNTDAMVLASFVAWIVSIVALEWGLWSGRNCFKGLAQGALFNKRTITDLRNFAFGLFIYKAVTPLVMLLLLVASWFHLVALPPNTAITGRDIGEGMFTLAALGAIAVIAGVLAYAAEIAEDNANIV